MLGAKTSEKANYPKVYHYRIVDVKVTSRAECWALIPTSNSPGDQVSRGSVMSPFVKTEFIKLVLKKAFFLFCVHSNFK